MILSHSMNVKTGRSRTAACKQVVRERRELKKLKVAKELSCPNPAADPGAIEICYAPGKGPTLGLQPESTPQTRLTTASILPYTSIQSTATAETEPDRVESTAAHSDSVVRVSTSLDFNFSDFYSKSLRQKSSNPLAALTGGVLSKEWAVVFDFFFSDGSEPNTNSPISYFGESFPMTFLFQNLNKSQNRLHHPVERPNLPNPPKHLTQSKIAFLHSEKSFTKPQAQVLDQLIATYFQVVHPVLPIIDRAQFMTLYHSDKVPWLLLHAVCFAASTHCSLDILCRDGVFCTRRDARTSFYNRAKALFDTDYERNRLVLLQAAVLLSFWGGEASDYWNTFSWVNTAINIAESLGMHRSVPTFEMPPLWKRIWWCLVTRDSFCSALLGQPLRINTKQCDLEMISKRDFETDIDPVGPGADLFGTRMVEHAYFVIEMAKLALILRTIIQARPNIRTDPEFVFSTNKQLEEWHSNLPPCLRLDFCTPDTSVQVLAPALALLYNHNLIYLHQPASEASPLSASITQNAVTAISDLGSSLVTESTLQFLPQDAYAAFFLAVIMLFAEIQNAQSIAEVRFLKAHVKICEMVVHQAREHWDHADWILSLSSNLRDKLVSAAEASRQGITSSSTIERMYTTPPQYPPQQPPDQQHAQMYDADIAEFVKSWETTTPSDTLFSEMSSLFADIDKSLGTAVS